MAEQLKFHLKTAVSCNYLIYLFLSNNLYRLFSTSQIAKLIAERTKGLKTISILEKLKIIKNSRY